MKAIVPAVAALLGAALLFTSNPVLAQSAAASITGQVLDQRTALPVVGAAVVLSHGGTPVARTTTNGDGRYTIPNVQPAVYDLSIAANGYTLAQSAGVAVASGNATVVLNAALIRADTGGSQLQVIGRTAASGHNALAAATTISQDISVENLLRTGQQRVVDQLETLPGLEIKTSSSVGDDTYAAIRGFGPSETQVLLDGHPVGPLGVLPGGNGGFNLADTPTFGLSNVNVTYGSGAQGLYGSDTFGGSIDLQTLNPTQRPHASFQQEIGGFGKLMTGVSATGTVNRLAYAFAAAVAGEYGDFHPGQLFQSARPSNVDARSVNPPGACNNSSGNDVSACNAAVSTYAVSQNVKLTSDVAKLRYNLSPVSALTATAYVGVQWGDSTGNGDNDFLPYSSRLAKIQASPTTCTLPGGAGGYAVITDPVANTTACYTARQFAAASSGPDGGGAGRQRSTSMRDYHLRFNTVVAKVHNITVDGFYNNYVYWKDSSIAGGYNAAGQTLGSPLFANFYNTKGFLIADDIIGNRNDFGFGYYVQHQLQTGNTFDNNSFVFRPDPTAFFGEGSAFVRDTYRFSDALSLFANAWIKRSSVTQKTTFDPRVTALYRPTHNDVVRLTYGRSDGAPAPSLKATGVAIANDPGSSLTAVSCNGFNQVTTGGNPALLGESANDFELGYGHRFAGDGSVNVNAYVTAVKNQLFSSSEPLTAFGAGNVVFTGQALQTYISHLNNQCGLNLNSQSVLSYLSVGTTYNAAHALARGIELSGRARINRVAYVDYAYTITSSVQTGLNDFILQNNPTVTNGTQVAGVPLHKATVSIDVAPGPWEFRIDNYYVEFNNNYDRPSYWYSNAFLSRALDRRRNTYVTLGGTNIFNNAVDVFGRIGQGSFTPENPFFSDAPNGLAQYVSGNASAERFGLAPAQLTLTLSHRM
ncbi:MAG: TonB-dependent receptor [Candidatus Eremiobacteraeota bacterium]|nr:TonB-dependent receptor [Candidatus Eremiobacteraeota bacterium]